MDRFNIEYIEQPIKKNNFEDLLELRFHSDIPIALDESIDSVQSINDGSLSVSPIFSAAGKDAYLVDHGVSLGSFLDRNNGVMRECGAKFKVDKSCYLNSGYPGLSEHYDSKGLTYTSGELSEDMVVAGHPVVRLWVTANTEDADFFVTLEEVEPDSTSHFVTANAVRASHRTINKAPFNNLGLPWLGHFEADAKMLTRKPSTRRSMKPSSGWSRTSWLRRRSSTQSKRSSRQSATLS